jgi:hypothetical protein
MKYISASRRERLPPRSLSKKRFFWQISQQEKTSFTRPYGTYSHLSSTDPNSLELWKESLCVCKRVDATSIYALPDSMVHAASRGLG